MSEFALVLLTRICVRDVGHERLLALKHGARSTEDRLAYFAARAKPFLEMTLESVRAHTRPPLRWFLLFDSVLHGRLAELYRPAAELPYARLLPLRAENGEEPGDPRYYLRELVRAIDAELPEEVRHVVTVGLDSDDCIHKDLLASLHDHLGARPDLLDGNPVALSFPFGLVDTGQSIAARWIPSNMFAALVESRQRFRDGGRATVYQTSHIHLPKVGRLIEMPSFRPMWLKRSTTSSIALRNDLGERAFGVPVFADRRLLAEFGPGAESLASPELLLRQFAAAARASGMHERARGLAAEAVALSGGTAAALHELALCCARDGLVEEARLAQEGAVAHDPAMRKGWRWVMEALVEARSWEAARQLEDELRGLLLPGEHVCGLAEADLERAAQACPDWAWPVLQLARRALARREFEAAELLAERAVAAAPGWAEAHLLRGVTARRRGDAEAAYDILRRCLELAPDLVEAHLGLAEACYDLGRFAECVDHIQRAVDSWIEGTPPAAVLVMLREAALRAGRIDQANQALLAANAIHPFAPEVQALLCPLRR